MVSASLVCLSLLLAPVFGCTIFVLTDGARTLFFNNEDWSNPKTQMWFVPAGEGYFGCAYVGFDDCWAQGGVNTEEARQTHLLSIGCDRMEVMACRGGGSAPSYAFSCIPPNALTHIANCAGWQTEN